MTKSNEINTSYNQDQPIGDTPSDYPASGAEPIDAKTGQDFLDVDVGEEYGGFYYPPPKKHKSIQQLQDECTMHGTGADLDQDDSGNQYCKHCDKYMGTIEDWGTESYGMPTELMTDIDLIESRNRLRGKFENLKYLNQIETEIRNRGISEEGIIKDVMSGDWIYTDEEREQVKKLTEATGLSRNWDEWEKRDIQKGYQLEDWDEETGFVPKEDDHEDWQVGGEGRWDGEDDRKDMEKDFMNSVIDNGIDNTNLDKNKFTDLYAELARDEMMGNKAWDLKYPPEPDATVDLPHDWQRGGESNNEDCDTCNNGKGEVDDPNRDEYGNTWCQDCGRSLGMIGESNNEDNIPFRFGRDQMLNVNCPLCGENIWEKHDRGDMRFEDDKQAWWDLNETQKEQMMKEHMDFKHNIIYENVNQDKYFDQHEYDPIMEDGFSYQEQEGSGGYFTCKKCGDIIHYDGWAKDVDDLLYEHLETHGITESLNKDGTGIKRATRGVNPNKAKHSVLRYVYVSKDGCDICKQYDGMSFMIDSPNRPVIPRLESGDGTRPYTHPHCKCKWVNVMSDHESYGKEVKQETVTQTKMWVEKQGIDFDAMTRTQQFVSMIQWMKSKEDAEEYNDKHNKSDGKFAKKDGDTEGWHGEPTKNKNEVMRKLVRKYPTLSSSFVKQQVDRADEIRVGLVKMNDEITNELKKVPNITITNRIKKTSSMVGKLARKPDEYKDVSDLYDVSGVKAMSKDLTGAKSTIDYIRSNYNVVKEKDNIEKDRGGYRSYHAVVEKDGKQTEIQVLTKNQEAWAFWAHEIYKPQTDELEQFVNANREVLNTYSSAMSQYFYEVDLGLESEKPECPPQLEGKLGCI